MTEEPTETPSPILEPEDAVAGDVTPEPEDAVADDVTLDDGAPEPTDQVTAGSLPRNAPIWWITGPLLVASIIATIVLLAWPAPYTTLSPGSATDTRSLIQIGNGPKVYRHPGEFLFVTVSELDRPAFLQVISGWIAPHVDVFPTAVVSGGLTAAQNARYSAVLMANSKQSATFQALSRLGFGPSEVANGVFVSQIVQGSPADGALSAGDTITNVSGTPIYSAQDLQGFLRHKKPGQTILLTVDRPGVSLDHKVTMRLGTQVKDKKKVPYMGIFLETRPSYKLPFRVDFDTGNIGGPSAGLALTLSLMDKLSPTGLTKGHKIAVTGTMEVDGSVGPIGGIAQKIVAVRESGAQYFLVPTDEYAQAKELAGPKLKVFAVTSLDNALAVLKKLPTAH